MKYLHYLAFLLIIANFTSCIKNDSIVENAIPIDESSLNEEEIFIIGLSSAEYGKCYQGIEEIDGVTKYKEIFCSGQPEYYERAQFELLRLGYVSVYTEYSNKIFGKNSKEALADFKSKNDLTPSILDQAALRKLIFSE